MKAVGVSALFSPTSRREVLSPVLNHGSRIIGSRILPRHCLTSAKRISWKIRSSEVEPTKTETQTQNDGEAEIAEQEKEVKVDPSFVAVFSVDTLPKGTRKEAMVDGKQIAIFWYRSEIFACETRSPTEGAFSTGFLDATFTENYGIVCPSTSTVFSLKTGEIMEWYPNNFVLKNLIPQDTCRPLEVYPVQVANNTIYVSFEGGSQGGVTTMTSRGGANTSLEDNNVFGLEPQVYADQKKDLKSEMSSRQTTSKLNDINPATILIATIAVGIVSVAGTGAAIYYESITGLIIFWIFLFGGVAFTISNVLGIFNNKSSNS